MADTYNFGDGQGPVPAHRHPNGGGWVADTATVSDLVYVHRTGTVFGYATVGGRSKVGPKGVICGHAAVGGEAKVLTGTVTDLCTLGGGDSLLHGERLSVDTPTHEWEGHRSWKTVDDLSNSDATDDES